MLLEILAAATAATADAAMPPDRKPAAWYKKPSAEDIHAAWPVKALTNGIAGKAIVRCRVNIHGLTEDCEVMSEDPPGEGFGAAALLLTPDFLFKPAMEAAGPVASQVLIPIKFDVPAGRTGGGLALDTFILLDRPVWAQAPGFADLGAAYPKAGAGLSGYVALRCGVRKMGELKDCAIMREEPGGRGFGSAARSLTQKFRVALGPDASTLKKSIEVNLPIRLVDPAGPDFVGRKVGEPVWTQGIDPAKTQQLFPAEAAARGLKTGVGVVDCAVSTAGALTDCTPLVGRPDGAGFSEAAVRVALVMKMNLWTQDGGPVDGARVKLPIRFYLAPAKPAPAAP